MAVRFIRIDPDGQYVRHSDWESWNLSFQCIVHNGRKYVRVEGDAADGLNWFNYVNGLNGVTATILTEEQLNDIKDAREMLSLEVEIPRLRLDLAAAEARYTELGGDPGSL
jgi:hypothetical protein